ncbi:MinD/ParA family protein [Corynebacterium hansenii]|uniref:MinD/ParA family protein n=1 Tax=Corynebacterium hansenii TaxID=394964 RepID=A0ABV7ZSP4_9CORY|nr:MinD/ParA family protein [Corynebacterium hansenii]WJZ00726.1 Sporulation initiation inhibitor protein Soj [Corynebacterium hansenii]
MRGDSYGASAPSQQIIFDPTVRTHALPTRRPSRQAQEGARESARDDAPDFDGRPLTVGDIAGLVAERPRPGRGWRAAVHRASGGRLNPGESPAERDERELLERIRRPVIGDYRVAVLSVKGGVGKTSTTIGLGATFASLRGDRIIAIDANPDFGTLAHRVADPNPATVRDLLRAPSTDRYAEVRSYTTQAPSRLEILGSERDPSISEAFSAADYDRALGILRRHYNILLTDCGTGIVHDTVGAILAHANCLVLVATPALDGARSAWATLDWLSAHGWADLVSSTVVVVNQLTDVGADADSLRDLFGQRCRAVQVIPHDPHIARGADIDIDLLRPATRLAYRELAAMIADDFAQPGGRHR